MNLASFLHIIARDCPSFTLELRAELVSEWLALRVVDHEQAALVAAYDACLVLDRGEVAPTCDFVRGGTA